MKLCTAAQMRDLEQAAVAAGTTLDALMEDAGLAVAQEVWLSLGVVAGRRILVLVGPGNNGGDGLVAARHLADWDADVCVYALAPRNDDKASLVRDRGVPVFVAEADAGYARLSEALDGAEVIIDAMLGTGRSRPLDGQIAEILQRARARLESGRAPKVISVDLPTGVDADTGAADPLALSADLTVTFGVAKLGLYTLPGSERAGRVEVVDIGLPAEQVAALPYDLLTTPWVRERLPRRPKTANKGTFGKALVVAGSRSYVGAARLAAEGAYRAGAGLVEVACTPAMQGAMAVSTPEAIFRLYETASGALEPDITAGIIKAMSTSDATLVGPGLTTADAVSASVRALVAEGSSPGRAMVLDADALNILAAWGEWPQILKSEAVLTPHPGEMARLLGTTVEVVQSDRLKTAIDAAAAWQQVVALKGAHTIIAAPDGRAAISPYANPLLAVAGTGDVLAGVIAGFLAQGMTPFEAAACGVYVHGLAAEELADDLGDRGLLASELLPAIPRAIRTILHGKKPPTPDRLAGLADFGSLAALAADAGASGGGPGTPGTL